MIEFKHQGSFKNTFNFLNRMSKIDIRQKLEPYGRLGVQALSSATPIDSGETANSWNYEIRQTKGTTSITWTNDNVINGVPVVILIEYGHATRNGGYVQGREFINPTIQPIFDKIANDIWNEVIR